MALSKADQEKRKGAFLQALASGLSVTRAADQAAVGRATVYGWRKSDAAFSSAWDDALEASADLLEDEARRRAVEGVEENVYYGGKPVGVVRKYSDSLLVMLLKGRRPAIYRDRLSAEVSGPDGGPVVMSDQERGARIEALLAMAKRRAGEKNNEDMKK
jgi:hypothetical protein